MAVKIQKLKLKSKKQFDVIDITAKVADAVSAAKINTGTVTVFCPHTTASVRLNHNEPLLMQDMMKILYEIAPVDKNYSHDLFEIRSGAEVAQRSNGHAHVKAFLMGSSEVIPVEKGKMLLGGKQSIFFVELDGDRDREVVIAVSDD